jgi:2-polyprenyl-3-methyl-5-hydroxy-6-metoxy-1,4-benzoquinol methylase
MRDVSATRQPRRVSKIGKQILPRRIRSFLNAIPSKWDSAAILDKQLVRDLMEFYNQDMAYTDFSLTYGEAVYLLKLGLRLDADLWKVWNPRSEEKIKEFYQITPWYPFELAYWHMQRKQRKFRKKVVQHCFGHVLDYGGGIGDLSLELAKKGLTVTYAEVKGKNMEFAKWLFARRGFDINILDLDQYPDLLQEYDTVLCIDVIEHVLHPEDTLERLAKHLKPNGHLIITHLDCLGTDEDNPMHFRIEFDAEKLLNSFGLFRAKHDWLWIKGATNG